jgi:short-subunit dehydrogenase
MCVVVVTGGSAGVGRAAVEAFAGNGWDVGIIARGQQRLDAAAAGVRVAGRRACAVSADVADADAVENAAAEIERQLGPIDVWVNNAMATVFGPVSSLTPEAFLRGTEVTYLGQVHGTMAALRRMRARGRGSIVNVGSALSYRAIPLQSVYCASKYAVRGFTDALRSELLHDRVNVHLTMVHLSAMNTPQFDWALNKTGRRPQPVPPIFEPEVAARAILFAATHRRREIWVGFPAVKAIVANKLFPGLLDRYLARTGYSGQLTGETVPADAPANLFAPASGDWGAHGRFGARSRSASWEMWTDRHRNAMVCAGLAVLGALLTSRKAARRLPRRNRRWP